MDNQEQDSESEERFKYAEAVRERMVKLDQDRIEKERQRTEEEVVKEKSDTPLLMNIEKGPFSTISLRRATFYGFLIGAVLGAFAGLVEIANLGGISKPLMFLLSGEGIGFLVMAGLIGGVLGAFIVGVIAYLLKKIKS